MTTNTNIECILEISTQIQGLYIQIKNLLDILKKKNKQKIKKLIDSAMDGDKYAIAEFISIMKLFITSVTNTISKSNVIVFEMQNLNKIKCSYLDKIVLPQNINKISTNATIAIFDAICYIKEMEKILVFVECVLKEFKMKTTKILFFKKN